MLLAKNNLFARNKVPLDIEVIFNPPHNVGVEKLRKIFQDVIKEIEPIIKLPKRSMLRAVSIKEKIEAIKHKILSGISLNFSQLIESSKDRTDVIITFLGLLELVKRRNVTVKQDRMFEEIVIEKI